MPDLRQLVLLGHAPTDQPRSLCQQLRSVKLIFLDRPPFLVEQQPDSLALWHILLYLADVFNQLVADVSFLHWLYPQTLNQQTVLTPVIPTSNETGGFKLGLLQLQLIHCISLLDDLIKLLSVYLEQFGGLGIDYGGSEVGFIKTQDLTCRHCCYHHLPRLGQLSGLPNFGRARLQQLMHVFFFIMGRDDNSLANID